MKCGIAIYSRDYISELNKYCDIITATIDEIFHDKINFCKKVDFCDLIHIQYETSLFIMNRKDLFSRFSRIKKPVIVSLHEVYYDFPSVFPKWKLRGSKFILPIKKILYDLKHPLQTAYSKHLKNNFYADLILVHYNFQKNILIQKGISDKKINVLKYPLQINPLNTEFTWQPGKTLKLGAVGFINPGFNYSLLFDVLQKLNINWEFTWIGGMRNDEQKNLLTSITNYIALNNWEKRFFITGWVSEEKQNELLSKIDIYLALFNYRSSSGTLTKAIGSLKPVIATELDLTRELNGPIITVKNDPDVIIESILKILSEPSLRAQLRTQMQIYTDKVIFPKIASRLVSLYKELAQ